MNANHQPTGERPMGFMGAEVPGEPAVRLRPGVFSPEHESPQEFQQRLVTERAMLMRKLELDAELGRLG